MAANELLTPSEVAELFRVNPKTVTRWARAGKISAVRTLGGHRRFPAAEIHRFLEEVGDLTPGGAAALGRIELAQHLTDDLGCLVSREAVTALGLCDLSGEGVDGRNTADQDVA